MSDARRAAITRDWLINRDNDWVYTRAEAVLAYGRAERKRAFVEVADLLERGDHPATVYSKVRALIDEEEGKT